MPKRSKTLTTFNNLSQCGYQYTTKLLCKPKIQSSNLQASLPNITFLSSSLQLQMKKKKRREQINIIEGDPLLCRPLVPQRNISLLAQMTTTAS